MVWEYYIKSRKVEDYQQMLINALYHPPHIKIDPEKSVNNTLYLVHHFEEKPLVKEFIANTIMGIEYLWGAPVQLETSEVVSASSPQEHNSFAGFATSVKEEDIDSEVKWHRVLYTMEDRKISKKTIE
jgi:stage V sporulation protein R